MEWPSRNYKCSKTIDECYEEGGIVGLTIDKLVGEGTFGKVYIGTAEFGPSKRIINVSKQNPRKSMKKSSVSVKVDRTSVAIKIIKGSVSDLDKIFLEIEFCLYMSELGIGPKVYHSFYKVMGRDITQFIVMEPMSMSCDKALEKSRIEFTDKIDIVSEMINLLEIQIFDLGLMCTDIKPQNYMVNIDKNNKNKGVKMIDFDSVFCKFDEDSMDYVDKKSECNNVFFLLMMIQLYKLTDPLYRNPFLINDIFKNRCLYAKYIFHSVKDSKLHIKHYVDSNPVNILKLISCNNEIVYTDLYNYSLKKFNNVAPYVNIDTQTRKTLISWIYKVCVRFKYHEIKPNVFFICVRILDRYLSSNYIEREKLQLTICAALYVTIDNLDSERIDPQDFIKVSDNAFTETELLEEHDKIVPYYVNEYTCYDILQILIEKIKLSGSRELDKTETKGCLMTITEIQEDYDIMYKYKPCTLVSSAIILVCRDDFDILEISDKCVDELVKYMDNLDMTQIKEVEDL